MHLTNERQLFNFDLGQVVENLQSLEATLRIILAQGCGPDPFKLQAGQQVPVTHMTNWATLGKLIKKFNRAVPTKYKLDKARIVNLRDALAHGFTLIKHPGSPTRLIKFGKPKNGMVRVEIAVDMTREWLAEQRKATFEAHEKDRSLYKRPPWPDRNRSRSSRCASTRSVRWSGDTER